MKDEPIKLTRTEAKFKASNFCAYQERSQKEVRNKLYSYGLYSNEVEDLLTELILDNFVNEERFAKAFIGGKFRMKKWGKQKILLAIRQHDISDYCCRKGLEEIDKEEYIAALESIIEKKATYSLEENTYLKRNKIAAYAISRGFESELVWEIVMDKIQ